MEDSILVSTKEILGLSEDYTPFDLEVMTHINAAFSTLHQIGVGPTPPINVVGKDERWSEIEVTPEQLAQIRPYVYLKTKLLFDPPTTSFGIEAANKQVAEFEWRLNVMREGDLHG